MTVTEIHKLLAERRASNARKSKESMIRAREQAELETSALQEDLKKLEAEQASLVSDVSRYSQC